MKVRTKEILVAIVLGAILPAIFFWVAWQCIVPKSQDQPPDETQTEPVAQQESRQIPVLMADSTVQMMDIDDYVTAVVLAEMPVDFEQEALKAQAVVARTYAFKRIATGNKHTPNAVCTDSSCCQAFCTDPEGTKTVEDIERVRTAVVETGGQVLTYGGELIEATYFSCSGGRTEDAAAVWGQDIPYLQSVESPGEEAATHYLDTVTFTSAEFCEKLGRELSGLPAQWIGTITYTEGGGVRTVSIGGKDYSGVEIRSLLGLRSTAFLITAVGDRITITTKGFGHRVGMSQYGAEAMAVQGSSYAEILAHYYPDTTLEVWSDN